MDSMNRQDKAWIGDESVRLNHDCVRNLLIYLENNLEVKENGLHRGIKLRDIAEAEEFCEFSREEIFYSADKLVEASFITIARKDVSPKVMIIKDITWKGHDYLDSIRDPKVWGEVKDRTKGMASVALEVIKCVAVDVTKNMLGIGN